MDNTKYSEALDELETIASQIEQGEVDIDSLAEKIKRANQLIKICRDRLEKTDEEIRVIMNEDAQ